MQHNLALNNFPSIGTHVKIVQHNGLTSSGVIKDTKLATKDSIDSVTIIAESPKYSNTRTDKIVVLRQGIPETQLIPTQISAFTEQRFYLVNIRSITKTPKL